MKKKLVLSVFSLLSIGGIVLGFVFDNHISIIYMVTLIAFLFIIALYDEIRKKPMETLIFYSVVYGILTIIGFTMMRSMTIFVLIFVDAYVVYQIYRKKGELY